MNLEESAFIQRPTLLGAQPESPGRKQFDSAREDVEEDGEAASALDAKFDASTGEETDASGHVGSVALSRAAPPKEPHHA